MSEQQPTVNERLVRKVYRGTPEHDAYCKARFGGGKHGTDLSFEFDGHRWAYGYDSFNDRGEYVLLWRPTDTPEEE